MKKKTLITTLTIVFLAVLSVAFFFIYANKPTLAEKTDIVWDGSTVATSFSGGNGTKDNPYLIKNGEELAFLKSMLDSNQAIGYKDLYYELSADINLGSHDLGQIGEKAPFSGHFDGKGHIISNVSLTGEADSEKDNYYGLFANVENGQISNLTIDGMKIMISGKGKLYLGTLAAKINNEEKEDNNINNILIKNIDIDLSEAEIEKDSKIATFIGEIGKGYKIDRIMLLGEAKTNYKDSFTLSSSIESDLNNILYNIKSESITQNGEVKEETKITNVYTFSGKEYYLGDKEVSTDDILKEFNKDLEKYEWVLEDDEFILREKKEEEKPKPEVVTRSAKSAPVAIHDTGIDTANKTAYINDLTSDYDYYMGLNYTGGGTVTTTPSGNSYNLYSDSNLAKIYIAYKGGTIDNTNGVVGYVSLTEQISDFVYYKYYPIKDGYVTIPLIDNPYADRPNNRAFNGWITDYDGAVVSLDTDDYTRYVKIPAPDDPTVATSITMYATWTEDTAIVASVSNNNLSTTGLKSVGMNPIATRRPVYGTLPTLYSYNSMSSGTGNQGTYYPNGAVTNTGASLNGQRCTRIDRWTPRTCYYYLEVSESDLVAGTTYYQLLNGSMQSYTLTPTGYQMNSFLNEGEVLAGFFKKGVPAGSLAGYYNASGVIQTSGSCTGTACNNYYELLQYDASNTFSSTNYDYYYLTTRDTNIAYLTGNINGFNNSVPVTVTGLHNGTNRSNYTIDLSERSINAGADLRIEYASLYTGQIEPASSGASNSNYNYIYGNYYNLKIGRGIPLSEGSYQSGGSWWNPTYSDGYYDNARGVVGGKNSGTGSAGTPSKYTFIVESGYYNSISSITTTSASGTYYVDATAIYGSDFDRITNTNNKLGVYYNATTTYGGTIRAGTDKPKYMTTIIKSGTFGEAESDEASGIYVGGLTGGNIYSPAELVVEGGDIFNINGGPLVASSVKANNIIYINIKGGKTDFIFGGAALSTTYGNRIISVTGGQIDYSVFGGSNGTAGGNGDGTLDGDSFIYIGGHATIGDNTSATAIWGAEAGSVFGAGNGNANYGTIGSVNNAKVIIDGDATVKKNVYGGGNFGAVATSTSSSNSTTNVKINNGNIQGSVYGGGNNNGAGRSATTATINIEMNGGTVDKSIYGGSCAKGIVYGNVNINIDGGTIETDVYGGGEGGYSQVGNVTNQGTYVSQNVNVTIGNNNKTTSPLIKGSVYGGSAFGSVNGTTNNGSATATYKTNVTVNKGTIVNNVFGGGKGGTVSGTTYTPKEYGDITVTINDGSIGKVFGGNGLMGSPGRNDTVYLKGGTIGNAFGGGNNTGQTTTNIYLQGSTITNNLYGGSNESGNITTSNVYVTSGTAQNIFGANNEGGLTNTTNVDISGGTINQSVYGGGNKVGAGTTYVDVTGGTITEAVYGGSNQAGTVTTSFVNINKNGSLANVYGGNNSGGNTISTNVTIVDGTITNVYGGGYNAISGSTKVDVTGGTITSLFGGGNYATVTETDVNVTGGTITNIYGGGNMAAVSSNTSVNVQNATITNSVFGGGNKGEVAGNSEVVFKNATANGSIYAGGNEADVKGNTTITVEGTSVVGTSTTTVPNGSVFGSGNSAGTGAPNSTKTATVNIVGGTVYGNVYGGANTSVVYGVTNVNIGSAAVNNTTLTEGDVWIKGTVYGGGESNAAGSAEYDYTAISVTEGINITINGDGYANNNHQFKLNGSIFGSGNASSSAGDSTIYIKKLGTLASPNDNLSIQRTTYLTIDESVIHLIGATDITNKYSNAHYSFNLIGKTVNEQHVGGLVLKNNSTLLLDQNANQLVSFTSAVDVNGNQQVATVSINDDTKTVTKNVDNRVYLLAGKNLNIAGDPDATDEGKVTGMTFFGIYRNSGGNITETGMYGPSYNYGSNASASDIVIGSSYILGQHHSNHDITLDGFYTNYLEDNKIKTAYIVPTPPNVDYYRWQIGTNAIEYEFTMTASKYLSMGTNSLSLIDFPNGDTTFTVLDFDVSELGDGLTMVDESEVPKFARVGSDESKLFGLNMKSESTEWTSFNKTSFLSDDNGSFDGDEMYLTSSDPGAPNMAFYLYHAKNIEMEGDLGTVIINMEAAYPKPGAEYESEIRYVTIKINIEAINYSDGDHYDASITYGKKYSMPITTPVNITPKSQFTEYYSLIANGEMKDIYGIDHDYYRTLVSSYVFPVGTTISLIDLSLDSPKYYYYEVNSTNYQQKVAQLAADNEVSYKLSDFIVMNTTTPSNKYNDSAKNLEYYDDNLGMAYEEFLFIFDFKAANISTAQLDNEVLFELRTDEDRTQVTVLDKRQEDRDMVFNIYTTSNIALSQTVDTANTNYYHDITNTTVYSTQVSYSTSGTSQKVIDTNYEASSMGVNIQLFDSQGTSVSSSMLSGTEITINNVDYYVDSDGVFRIKLADKVSNVIRNMDITVDSLLPAGTYTMKYSVIASSDGLHASDLNAPTFTQTIQVISADNIVTVTNNDKTKLFFAETGLNADGNRINTYQVKYNSTLDNGNLRLSIYKRNTDTSTTTAYTEIEFSKLFENTMTGTGSTVYPYEVALPFGTSPYSIPLTVNANAKSGTYKLVFKLCDNAQVVDTDEAYLIVKKPIASP